ncbi:hypothetical protein AVEN_259848-1 [Araneus ventricosus]|uniref:Uncharacterized protein n=1 Tax=Araneus ventricosus TaxID=182803 RepID=A0A4Y2DSL3_ARAVE|nr:hypothetical protein AVEN_259848-1 [Araneus ventricosus]
MFGKTRGWTDFVNFYFIGSFLTPRYAIKDHLHPYPSISERYRKNSSPLYILYGEKPSDSPPGPTTGPISTIFISYENLWPLDMSSKVACRPILKIKLWQRPSASTTANLFRQVASVAPSY